MKFQKLFLDGGIFSDTQMEFFLADARLTEEDLKKIKDQGLSVMYLRHGDDMDIDGCCVSSDTVVVNYYGTLVGAVKLPEDSHISSMYGERENHFDYNMAESGYSIQSVLNYDFAPAVKAFCEKSAEMVSLYVSSLYCSKNNLLFQQGNTLVFDSSTNIHMEDVTPDMYSQILAAVKENIFFKKKKFFLPETLGMFQVRFSEKTAELKKAAGEIWWEADHDIRYAPQDSKVASPAIGVEAKALASIFMNLEYVELEHARRNIDIFKTCLWCVPQNEQTERVCLNYLKKDGSNLQYVVQQTPLLCCTAVKQNDDALKYVQITSSKSGAWAKEVAQKVLDGELESFDTPSNVPDEGSVFLEPTYTGDEDFVLLALKNGMDIQSFPEEKVTLEVCLAAIFENPFALLLVEDMTPVRIWNSTEKPKILDNSFVKNHLRRISGLSDETIELAINAAQ